MKSEEVEVKIGTLSKELFEYKAYIEDFDQATQDEWYWIDQEVLVGLDRRRALDGLEKFLTLISMGRCKYCKIQMNPSGSTLADVNAWHCLGCGHEEVEMGSYSLGGRENPIQNCRCKNCIKEDHIHKFTSKVLGK